MPRKSIKAYRPDDRDMSMFQPEAVRDLLKGFLLYAVSLPEWRELEALWMERLYKETKDVPYPPSKWVQWKLDADLSNPGYQEVKLTIQRTKRVFLRCSIQSQGIPTTGDDEFDTETGKWNRTISVYMAVQAYSEGYGVDYADLRLDENYESDAEKLRNSLSDIILYLAEQIKQDREMEVFEQED